MKKPTKNYRKISNVSLHILAISLELSCLLFIVSLVSVLLSGNLMNAYFALPFANTCAAVALKLLFCGVLYGLIIDILFGVKEKENEKE